MNTKMIRVRDLKVVFESMVKPSTESHVRSEDRQVLLVDVLHQSTTYAGRYQKLLLVDLSQPYDPVYLEIEALKTPYGVTIHDTNDTKLTVDNNLDVNVRLDEKLEFRVVRVETVTVRRVVYQ